MSRPAERVVAFYNKGGTGEQWIKEGKGAIKWTRLSCRTFAANVVRLQLYALAYKDVGNVGSHPPLACGLPTSSENSYHIHVSSGFIWGIPASTSKPTTARVWRRQEAVGLFRWSQQLSWRSNLVLTLNRILRRFDVKLVRSSKRTHHDEIWRPLSDLVEPAPGEPTKPFSAPFLKGLEGSQIASLQKPADFAVVMPTVLQPTVIDAIQSVFDQRFDGAVQLLIGIDTGNDELARVEQFCRSVPDRQSVFLFYPGYSTSRRHGGVHAARDGGSLRTVLSYLANSRYVAYLDDDNWWSEDHLSTMYSVLSAGAEWAYALRWFVHPDSRQPICRDEWESVGPGAGFFRGWVDPNCLAIDKIACEAVLRWWSIPCPNSVSFMDADRNVFQMLSTEYRGAPTNRHSVFYQITETDSMHPHRLNMVGEQRYHAAGKRSE
jgi:Transposase DDE domain group 1